MSSLSPFLPQSDGLLPYWMLFVSSLAVFNSIQNFVTTSLTRKIYNRAPGSGALGVVVALGPKDAGPTQRADVNGLQARTFAIWTLASAAIRVYAAYNINTKGFYDLALISYVLALSHFGLEALVFRTAGLGVGLVSPLIVASTSLIWMTNQYGFYVRA